MRRRRVRTTAPQERRYHSPTGVFCVDFRGTHLNKVTPKWVPQSPAASPPQEKNALIWTLKAILHIIPIFISFLNISAFVLAFLQPYWGWGGAGFKPLPH